MIDADYILLRAAVTKMNRYRIPVRINGSARDTRCLMATYHGTYLMRVYNTLDMCI